MICKTFTKDNNSNDFSVFGACIIPFEMIRCIKKKWNENHECGGFLIGDKKTLEVKYCTLTHPDDYVYHNSYCPAPIHLQIAKDLASKNNCHIIGTWHTHCLMDRPLYPSEGDFKAEKCVNKIFKLKKSLYIIVDQKNILYVVYKNTTQKPILAIDDFYSTLK